MKKMLVGICMAIASLQAIASIHSLADNTLRIAILMRGQNTPPYISSKYIEHFIEGLNVAKYTAKKEGLVLKYKIFTMQDVSQLERQINQLKQWQPSLIIGPNYSNSFLLLKNYFKKTLVLSVYASDQLIASMPANFYTRSPLSSDYGQAIYSYIATKFPSANVFSVVDQDCKSCVDMNKFIEYLFKCNFSTQKLITIYKSENELNISSLKDNMNRKSNSDVIIMLTTSNSLVQLMVKIINASENEVVFIGADNWGDSKNNKIQYINTEKKFSAYHIVGKSLMMDVAQLKKFKKLYSHIYHKYPVDNVTFASFSAMDAVIQSLKRCNYRMNEDNKSQTLYCYGKDNSKLTEPKVFVVEKIKNRKNYLAGSVTTKNTVQCIAR